MSDFTEFPKMARWTREIVITEKIDGTNSQIVIQPIDNDAMQPAGIVAISADGAFDMRVGSRNRWLGAGKSDDNFGFARWCVDHAEELFNLGQGQHFGEWWGSGIQRGYGLPSGEKRFSLFNTSRWADDSVRPSCCHVVPRLYQGMMEPGQFEDQLERLAKVGSFAAPGFMNPEGLVLFHVAANMCFKKTLLKDEVPKGRG